MRRALAALALFLLLPAAGHAQTPLVEQSNWRYDEDWSVLRDVTPSPDDPWWLPAKYLPLTGDGAIHASFGLEARVRYEGLRNNFWGGGDAPDDGYYWFRAMPHADIHAGPLRVFAQLITGKAWSVATGNGPADATDTDVLQSFADLRLPLGEEGILTVRGGRALMPLGSERLVGARYGPNIPQAFDGWRATLQEGPFRIDAIDTWPVAIGQANFDDRSSDTKSLRGLYATTKIAGGLSLDAYWLDYRNEHAHFAQGAGSEHRKTYGLRAFGRGGAWSWNWEAMLQRGGFGGADIDAWSLATETAYRFAGLPLSPSLRLRANIASGDSDPKDGTLGTFNPMFPKGKYFGELSPLGPYNIINVHPDLELDLGDGVTLDLVSILYWRESSRDGIYDVPGGLIRDGQNTGARFIGTQGEVVLGWQADAALSFTTSFSVFEPGAFIRDSGPSRTIYMVGAETMYRF